MLVNLQVTYRTTHNSWGLKHFLTVSSTLVCYLLPLVEWTFTTGTKLIYTNFYMFCKSYNSFKYFSLNHFNRSDQDTIKYKHRFSELQQLSLCYLCQISLLLLNTKLFRSGRLEFPQKTEFSRTDTWRGPRNPMWLPWSLVLVTEQREEEV